MKAFHQKKNINIINDRFVIAAIVGVAGLSAPIYWINFRILEISSILSSFSTIQLYIGVFLFLNILYLSAVFLILKWVPRGKLSWLITGFILLSAIFFRACLIPPDPSVLSKDMYRYIWDGRVQQNGINPYLYPPQATELKQLRDKKVYSNINRKDYPTLYPAGAQLFFRAAYALVGDSVTAYKGVMTGFDILTLLLLIAMLQAFGFSTSRIIVYAWNPLVIFEIAYSGHLEGLTVFLMAAALYLCTVHKKMLGVIMVALAAAVKLYPALLLAAFLNRKDLIKGVFTFAATIIVLYLPFMGAGSKVSGFLPIYLKNPYESFNLGLKHLLMRLFPALDYYLLSIVFLMALAICGLAVFLKGKNDSQTIRYSYILVGSLLILMPASLHPWYTILIVPFLAFYPSPAWLIFSCTVTLSYLKYVSPQGIMPTWVLLAEYLPLFALLALGYIFRRRFIGSEFGV